MRVVVITSCTGKKAVTSDRAILAVEFQRQTPAYIQRRELELAREGLVRSAEDMYTGEQHIRLMRGVRALREVGAQVDVYIVSTGYGLIPGDKPIAPYEATFSAMKPAARTEWARHLQIPQAFRALLEQPFDLGLVLLGDDYLHAVAFDPANTKPGGKTAFLCSPTAAQQIRRATLTGNVPEASQVYLIELGEDQTREYHVGLVGLKGEVAARILEAAKELI